MRKTNRIAETRGDRIFDLVNHIAVALVLVVCIYPLYYTVIASLSEPENVLSGKVYLWIKGFTLDSYRSVIDYKMIWTGYRNTLLYTFVGTAYNLTLLIPASYALSKKEMKLRGPLMMMFVFTMYFGGGMIPTYMNLKRLGLINSRWVLILPGAFSVYNMIITRTFFASNFSESLAEAARIDGAGEIRIFFQLALPLSSAIIAVMALYYAVGHWNAYYNALLYIRSRSLYPLQLVLRNILINEESTSLVEDVMASEDAIKAQLERVYLSYAMKYALIFIAAVPMLIAYPFVQRFFVKGIMVGSVKG